MCSHVCVSLLDFVKNVRLLLAAVSINGLRKEAHFSHSEVYFTVKDLWSPMGVLQRGQKVKLM